VEGRGGERAGLKLVEFLEFGSVDKLIGSVDLDTEMVCKVPDGQVGVGLESELRSGAVGEPFGLRLESSSHVGYLASTVNARPAEGR
jgi:hypothetical protein